MSKAHDNFLKLLYKEINIKQNPATTTFLAEFLDITKAGITDLAKRLHDEGYVFYERYRPISLTPKGEEKAKQVIRNHRLWETFLHEVLKIPVDLLHEEAEKLEHETSEFLANSIDDFLHNPVSDPHGEPIPDRYLNMPKVEHGMRLYNAKSAHSYTVSFYDFSDTETSQFLENNGIVIGKEIIITGKPIHGDYLFIRAGENNISLVREIALNIFVKQLL